MFSIATGIASVKNTSGDYPLRNVVGSGAGMLARCLQVGFISVSRCSSRFMTMQ
jgi:hypothetical protein